MIEVLSDPLIYAYLDYDAPATLEQLQSVYTRQAARHSPDGKEQWLNWVLRLHDSGKLIGTVQATVLQDSRSWVAYVLSPAYWGLGYATQATQAMMHELRDHYAVTQCMATVEYDNQLSIKLLLRLGFEAAPCELLATHELTATERLFVKALV